MRRTDHWVMFLWIAAFLALVGNASLSTHNLNVLIANERAVTNTQAARQAVSDLFADILQAETGHRGYVITSNPTFLGPYKTALARLPIRQQIVRQELANDPVQLAKFAAVEPLIAAKLREMDRTLTALRTDGPAAAQASVAEGQGKRIMDEIRTRTQEISTRETEQLEDRSKVAAEKYQATRVTNLLGGIITFLMVALAYAVLRRELVRRRAAEVETRLSTGALAVSQKLASESLAQLDALFDHAPIGIALYNNDLRYQRINRVLAASNDLSAAEHIGRRTDELMPHFPADLLRDFQTVLGSGQPMLNRLVRFDEPRANSAGSVWEVTLFPVPEPNGGGRGLGVFAQDVSVRESHTTQLRRSEDQFRTLADAVPQFVWVTRPDGYHEFYNSRWYDYTGLTPAECLGHAWADPLHPEDAARSRARWKQSLDSGEPYEIEYRFRNHAGNYRWFIGRAQPVRNADGVIERWFGTCTDIDDQKRLETAVRASARQLLGLTEAVPGFIFSSDAAGQMTYVNEQFLAYTRIERDRTNPSWQKVIHPDDRGAVDAEFARAVRAGRGFDAEYRVRRFDGVYRWFQTRGVPVADEAGVLQWYGISTDIDATKSLATRLETSERRLRVVSETVPGFVWSALPDGRLDYVNKRYEMYTGEPAATVGSTWLDRVHPEDQEHTLAAWASARETISPYQAEFRIRRADGVYRWFLAQALPAHDETGAVEHWYGVSSDVDEFKAVTLRAETNAERFRLLTEAIPQMVWNADADGQVTYFNSRWVEYTGLNQAAALFDWWGQVLHPADAAVVQAAWSRVVTGDLATLSWEVRIRCAADGQYRWFLASVTPLCRPDGSIDQWIGSLSDIDDQKRQSERLERMVREQTTALMQTNDVLRAEVADRLRAEQREREAAIELRRSNAELEKFAYVASHDLQEPLRKIQTFGQRLADRFKPNLGEQGQDYIDRMLSSATRMRGLIDDLLTFSRVATRTTPFAPVALNEAVQEALQNLEARLEETGGQVEVGPLPAVPADASQMRQLFQNLIGNALKFARPGVPPVVTVSAQPTPHENTSADPPAMAQGVRLVVSDNGIGFEQVYAERIFDVFQRLHGRSEYEGTGIGLAICRKIVERHGGGITARSTPGTGTTFIIDLPDTPGLGPSPQPPEIAMPQSPPAPALIVNGDSPP